jgi:Fe-S-cluster containining protein
VKRIAKFRGERVYDLVMACDLESRDDGGWWLRMRGNACPFLVDDRCSIQEVKPRQCRAYPFWPEFVEDAEAWDAERELCPGMEIGPVWAASDVQAMLNLLDE